MADVWDFGPEDATLTNVLVVLANSADDDGGNCFPGTALIARRTRYSERTVVRAIAELARQGWITVLQRGAGRPRGGNRREKAAYMSQYLIHVERLKECQPVTLSPRSEKVTPIRKKVTLTTEKGDTDDNPPHPLFGVPVRDPSVTQKTSPQPPQAGADGFTAEQQAHLERCAPEMRAGFEEYYREQNRKAMEVAEEQRAKAKRLEELRLRMPDEPSAVDWVMRQCGFYGDERRRGVRGAIAAVIAAEHAAGCPLWEVAREMAEAWRDYSALGELLAVQYGPVKFFHLGIWARRSTWRLDERKRAQREARVGS